MLIMKLVACQRRKTVSKVGLKICFRNFWDLKFWRNENCETYMSAIIFKVLDALILLRKTIQNWRMEPSCPWDLPQWMKNWAKSLISFIMNTLSTIRSKFVFAIWLSWNSNMSTDSIKYLPMKPDGIYYGLWYKKIVKKKILM